MNEEKIYRGEIRTGRGGAVGEMSKPGGLEGFQMLTGLSIIPGTLNIKLTEPFKLLEIRRRGVGIRPRHAGDKL